MLERLASMKEFLLAEIAELEQRLENVDEVSHALKLHKEGLLNGMKIGNQRALDLIEQLEKEAKRHEQLR